jgi:hypothetical protein
MKVKKTLHNPLLRAHITQAAKAKGKPSSHPCADGFETINNFSPSERIR